MRGDNADDGWKVTPYSCTYDRGNPPEWQKRSDSKIYFYADPAMWQNYEYIGICIYEHNGDILMDWGSKKGRMTDEGNNIWSYDIAEKGAQYGFTLDDNSSYGVIFSADWERQSCDLIIGNDCLGDMAYLTGGSVENPVDSNKSCDIAEWVNADPAVYATPVLVTSLGNVIGETLFKGETFYSTYCAFLESGIDNAVKYSGKTAIETVDDFAKTLGLSKEERDRAFKEADITEQGDVLVRSGDTLIGFQIPNDGGHVMSLDEVKEHLDEFLEIGRSRYAETNLDFVRLIYNKGYLRFERAYYSDDDKSCYAMSAPPDEVPFMQADGTVTAKDQYPLFEETDENIVLWQIDNIDKYGDNFR